MRLAATAIELLTVLSPLSVLCLLHSAGWHASLEKLQGEEIRRTACKSSLLLAWPVGVPLANLACFPRGSMLFNSEGCFAMPWLHAERLHTPSDSTVHKHDAHAPSEVREHHD